MLILLDDLSIVLVVLARVNGNCAQNYWNCRIK